MNALRWRWGLVIAGLFLGMSRTAAAQDWSLELAIGEPEGAALSARLGMAAGATDGVDRSLGEVEWPPLPPLGTFDVRMVTPQGRLLLVDLRSSGENNAVFSLVFQRSHPTNSVRINWDRDQLPPGCEFRLRDGTEKNLFDLDMRSVDAYEVGRTEVDRVEIEVRKTGAPGALFQMHPDRAATGEKIVFTDVSSGEINAWSWDFGDGATASTQNPEHAYSAVGAYAVELVVSGPGGGASHRDTIEVLDVPRAAFRIEDDELGVGQVLALVEESVGQVDSWEWEWGDGTSSQGRLSSHAYDQPGTYIVTLRVNGPGGSSAVVDTVEVFALPIASFSSGIRRGYDPLSVTFANASSGIIETWQWDFGDGSSSRDRTPSHTYTVPGTYTVSLTVSGPGGAHTSQQRDYIQVDGLPSAPYASFEVQPLKGYVGLTPFSFTDYSSGDIATYSWNFGTAASVSQSTQRHPSGITFDQVGKWVVKLTVSGMGGATTETRTVEIVPVPPPRAAFSAAPESGLAPLSVAFDDASEGHITSRRWDFGDGTTSSQENPTHTYTVPGAYLIRLAVDGPGGISSAEHTVYIFTPPQAGFELAEDSIAVMHQVELSDRSTGDYAERLWEWGDGTTSGDSIAQHTFENPGEYPVKLTVSGPAGVSTFTNTLWVFAPPQANFSFGSGPLVAGETVSFVEASTGEIAAREWDLGDGTLTSGTQVSHVYPTPGRYRIRLTVRGPGGETSMLDSLVVWSLPELENLAPIDGETDVSLSPALEWDGDAELIYDVRFDTLSPPQRVAIQGTDATSLPLVELRDATTFFWQITGRDSLGLESSTPVWSFTTEVDDRAPVFLADPAVNGVSERQGLVNWKTDEKSSSWVEYGERDDFAEALQTGSDSLQVEHAVIIDGLKNDTRYFFRVWSTDRAGNESERRGGWLDTRAVADTTGPLWTQLPTVSGLSDRRVTIGWTTDEAANSELEFGLAPAMGQSATQEQLGALHRVELQGLLADTTYFFRARSADLNGNYSAWKEGRFNTLAVPDSLPPQITGGPIVTDITDGQAVIEWTSDEACRGTVGLALSADLVEMAILQEERFAHSHSLPLTELLADTTYYFDFQCRDEIGNVSRQEAGTFHTLAVPDTEAPILLEGPAAVRLGKRNAAIAWTTDERATTHLGHARSADFSDVQWRERRGLSRSHKMVVNQLEENELYYFRVYSTDVSGNRSEMREGSFRTRAVNDSLAPRILAGPLAIAVKDSAAQLEWTMDEEAAGSLFYGAEKNRREVPLEEFRRHQRVFLTRLTPGTIYKYQVRMEDSSGNEGWSEEKSFTTRVAADTSAPRIVNGPVVVSRKCDQVMVEWVTDETSDSQVWFGLRDSRENRVDDVEMVRKHSVRLTQLIPGKRYHCRVRSTDSGGNGPATSAELTFTTPSLPDAVSPQIMGEPVVVARTDRSAVIGWQTDEASDSFVEFGEDGTFERTAGSSELVDQHAVALTRLRSGRTYHFRVRSMDAAGNGVDDRFREQTFVTRDQPDSLAPVIVQGPFVSAVTQTTARVEWETDEPADSRISVEDESGRVREEVSMETGVEHALVLGELRPGGEYRLRVGSADASGNGPTRSDEFVFSTSSEPDEDPPVLMQGPRVERITETGAAITWMTDEPAHSAVSYGRTADYELGSLQEMKQVRQHVVELTNLSPGTTYRFFISSADESGNRLTTDPRDTRQSSRDLEFTTSQKRDEDPPVFLERPVVHVRDTGGTLEWNTDEPVRYRVEFDTVASLDSRARERLQKNRFSQKHSVEFTHLRRNRAYFYRLQVWDVAGNRLEYSPNDGPRSAGKVAKASQIVGNPGSFSTLDRPDTLAPVIVQGPWVTHQSSNSLTVEWETDERSDSAVDFGHENAEWRQVDPTYARRHRVVLTNLAAGRTYRYTIGSTDPSGNGPTAWGPALACTARELDLTPPRFTAKPGIVWVAQRTAMIEWETDEPSASVIEFGTRELDRHWDHSEPVRVHKALLTQLDPDALYHFRVGAMDNRGNEPHFSEVDSFFTSRKPDLSAPVILGGPEVISWTDRGATIAWETDEPADSFVEYQPAVVYLDAGQEPRSWMAGTTEKTRQHRIRLTHLQPGSLYYYRVKSADIQGNETDSQASWRPLRTAALANTVPPEPPMGLRAVPGDRTVWLHWEGAKTGNFAGFTVYRGRMVGAETGPSERIASQLTSEKFEDYGVTNEVPYFYQVTAVDLEGNESWRSEAVVVSPSAEQVPGAPIASGIFAGTGQTILQVVNVDSSAGSDLAYTFQLARDPLFREVVAGRGGIPAGGEGVTAWTCTKRLIPGKAYWWRTRVSLGQIAGKWMAPVRFSVEELPGDFDADDVVTFNDFFLFAESWEREETSARWNSRFDIEPDGRIDFADFFAFTDFFGRTRIRAKPVNGRWKKTQSAVSFEVDEIDRERAELVLRLATEGGVRGYGAVLQHARGLRITPSGSEDGMLHQILQRESGRTWIGGYWPAGPVGKTVELRLPAVFQGAEKEPEVVLEELWIEDERGEVQRATPGARALLVPRNFALGMPFPNPFNPAVSVAYSLPAASRVRAEVFNILGQKIRTLVDARKESGFHRLVWQGTDRRGNAVSSGVYFIYFESGDFRAVRKIALLR